MAHNNELVDNWKFARDAINSMAKYGIKPDANNYAVWLAYHSASNINLRNALEESIQTGKNIDEKTCLNLFENYIENSSLSDRVLDTGNSFAHELLEMVSDLEVAGEKTKKFNAELAKAKTDLKSADRPDKILGVVNQLEDATNNMENSSKSWEAKLDRSRKEIERLKNELETAKTEATTDALTGLANRKKFEEFLNNSITNAQTNNNSLSLILSDIDYFKRVNDRWGHQTGDQVICFIASVLEKEAPKGALVARLGGEEFAIIIPNMNEQQTHNIAEKARLFIKNKKLIRKSSKEDLGEITVSHGIAMLKNNEASEDLIGRADRALYHSKNSGRNKTTICTETITKAA